MSYLWREYLGHVIDGRYVLDNFIEQTGSSVVFTTSVEGMDGTAVIRLMPEQEPEAEERLKSWSIASNLCHAGLIRVYAAGRTELEGSRYVYAVTKRPDENLEEVIRERALTNEEARVVLESILPAILYLHQHKLVHRKIAAEGIGAVGNQVKLTSDFIADAPAGAEVDAYAYDAWQTGATVVEILTQQRPDGESLTRPEENPLVQHLDPPFREIATGCVQSEAGKRWTIAQCLGALTVPEPAPAPAAVVEEEPEAPPVQSPPKKSRAAFISTAAVLAVAAVIAVRQWTTAEQAPIEPAPVSPAALQPKSEPAPAPPPEPAPEPASQLPSAARAKPSSEWVVVAAIYRGYEAAERRAQRIAQRWHQSPVRVFPEKGRGSKYMVIVGSAGTQREAESIRLRARQAGLPPDTYVTKITPAFE